MSGYLNNSAVSDRLLHSPLTEKKTMVPREERDNFVIKLRVNSFEEEQRLSNSDMIQFNHYADILNDHVYSKEA